MNQHYFSEWTYSYYRNYPTYIYSTQLKKKWYGTNNSLTIQALSIIGGILTAIFLLGFMFVSSIIDTELSAMITGVILIVATLFINRSSTASFLDAMNITLYVAGTMLLGYGLFQNLVLLLSL